MINIYGIEEEVKAIIRRMGDVEHCRNIMVNLLLMEEGEKAHYIYIKKLKLLLHICKATFYKDMEFCPPCCKGVKCVEESLEDHLMTKHFSTTNNCNLQLAEEGATMKFKSFKDMMIRPYMVYSDFECSPINNDGEEGRQDARAPAKLGSLLFSMHPRSKQKRVLYIQR